VSDQSITGVLDLPAANDSGLSLISRLTAEMRDRWCAGDRVRAEFFLDRHPELDDQPEAAIRLILEEFCLHQECGAAVTVAEFVRRFPRWRGQLEVVLRRPYGRRPTARQDAQATLIDWPQPGQYLGEYQILATLGHGSQGCVYLAAQPELADRVVVLKVTPCLGQEHLALARLQHTHIMPLYSAHNDHAADRRILCMPYHGGAALNRVLEHLEAIPARQRRGRDLLDAIDRRQPDWPLPAAPHKPARQLLQRLTYAQAVCWLGACLADALQYAHARGLVHLDVKPGNVLLTAEGQPMLLDFHLAQRPLAAGAAVTDWLGGTPAYMAPEQRDAIQAVNQGRPVPRGVDGRADVFALGVLLYEALGGVLPTVNLAKAARLDRLNPQVSVGLADVVAKCLAVDPGQRYASAGALAADLRRHLEDLPLRGVSNRSLGERWDKWQRRKPHALRLLALGTAVVAAAVSLALVTQVHSARDRAAVKAALAEGRQALRQRDHARAAERLAQGLALAENLGLADDAAALREALQEAQRAQAARRLRALVDRLRFAAGGGAVVGDLGALQPKWREVWDRRRLLLDGPTAESEPGQSALVRTDLRDLVTLWADLRLRSPQGLTPALAEELLAVLDEAEALFGPSRVLAHQRRVCLEALGRAAEAEAARGQAETLAPRTAWEHTAQGRSLLHAGEVRAAAAEFRRALTLRPQDFWPNFYEGVCAYRVGDHATAAAAFRTCVALAPGRAEGYYNRGLALAALGRNAEALADYTRALALEPASAAAALSRGVLHLQEKEYPQALADLERARALGADAAVVQYNLALAHLGRQDRAAAVTHLRRAVEAEPGHAEARALLEKLEPRR
jgi:serine/threonine protein kinase/Flp pilus assembly protein TadD